MSWPDNETAGPSSPWRRFLPIGLAVLATTLSIVAVFLPIGFMGGIIGNQILHDHARLMQNHMSKSNPFRQSLPAHIQSAAHRDVRARADGEPVAGLSSRRGEARVDDHQLAATLEQHEANIEIARERGLL